MSGGAGWAPIRWARSDAPTVLRKDGKPDTVAHLVLVSLATYAGTEGTARPGLPALATDCRLTDRACMEALRRLQDAKLIEPHGDFNGVPVWQLRMDLTRGSEEKEAREKAREIQRQKANARQRRCREQKTANSPVSHAEPKRDVTPNLSVTTSASHAPLKRDVTPSLSVSHALPKRDVTLREALQPLVTPPVTAIELPLNCHIPPGAPLPGELSDLFDEFWSAYPRKESKQASRTAFTKAVEGDKRKRLRPVAAHEIVDAARRYAVFRQGEDPKFTKIASTWLHGRCWEDELPTKTPPAGPHRPFLNADNPDAYQRDGYHGQL